MRLYLLCEDAGDNAYQTILGYHHDHGRLEAVATRMEWKQYRENLATRAEKRAGGSGSIMCLSKLPPLSPAQTDYRRFTVTGIQELQLP